MRGAVGSGGELAGSVVASGGAGVAQAARTTMPTPIIPLRTHDAPGRVEARSCQSSRLLTVTVNHTGGTEITPATLVPHSVC